MKRALVAIGVDQTGGLPKLRAAADGAKKVKGWATKQGFDTKLLTDQRGPVTIAGIKAAVRHFVDAGTYDQLVVYFSGHGFLKGPGYEVWLLSDAPRDPDAAVNVTGSIDLARNCGISHLVFISDACRSIPGSQATQAVSGGVIFPSVQPKPERPEVDVFYGTIPGDPALEIPPDEATRHYRGIFTECLLEALVGNVSSVVVSADPNGTRRVVPSRPLKEHLRNAVPEAASAVSIKLQQHPEIRVESAFPPMYLSEIRARPAARTMEAERKATLAVMAAPPSPSTADALATLRQTHLLGQSMTATEALEGISAQAVSREINELATTKGRISFETRTGFTVHGAKVESVASVGAAAQAFQEGGLWHVRVDPRQQESPWGAAGSTVIRFDTGTGTCLAAMPGYVGTVVVDGKGRVVSVMYTPARSSDQYQEYVAAGEELDRRRAFVAVAARHGVFSLDPDEAADAARYLRVMKSIDPTLGIYAAYAYAQAGNQRGVKSVLSYMADSIYGRPTIPFDVAMLAERFGAGRQALACAPTMPMLTQGWALLGALEKEMNPAALKARQYLVPSLWTTFSTKGVDLLQDAIAAGSFRWT